MFSMLIHLRSKYGAQRAHRKDGTGRDGEITEAGVCCVCGFAKEGGAQQLKFYLDIRKRGRESGEGVGRRAKIP